jgi:hypothetical protein
MALPTTHVRFYNPGQRIMEKLPYTNNTRDLTEVTNLSYYTIDAPEKDFFNVPSVFTLKDVMGREYSMYAPFPAEIKRIFAPRGVVEIRPDHDQPIDESDNLALNEADAKVKGDAMYHEHLMSLVNDWFDIVARAQADNRIAKPAQGAHKHALKVLHITDPAATVSNLISAEKNKTTTKENDERVKALEAQIAEQAGQMKALMALMAKQAGEVDGDTSNKKNGK